MNEIKVLAAVAGAAVIFFLGPGHARLRYPAHETSIRQAGLGLLLRGVPTHVFYVSGAPACLTDQDTSPVAASRRSSRLPCPDASR